MTHPDPNRVLIDYRYFKDNPEFRKEVIALFKAEEEKGPGPGGGGVFPKNRKPFPVSHPMLYENGWRAKQVDGQTLYVHPYKRVKAELPQLTKEIYKKYRKLYLLDE